MEGFGRIAIGVALGLPPEIEHYISWSALLTAPGLLPEDKVLLPEARQPTHWARNEVVRSFLKIDIDSLLFVDSDMVFAPDTVEKLRTDERTYDYDIIQAFCTHRVGSPKPVIMRLHDPQPEEPLCWRGDHFDIVHDFEDGEVLDVDTCGMAFTLIRRGLLDRMTDPKWGPDYTWYFQYHGRESEDIYFCREARKLGARMCVNTAVKVKHLGMHMWGWEEFQRFKKMVE